MPHNAALHQCLHCLLSLKNKLGTEIYHNLEIKTNLKIRIVSNLFMGKSIGMENADQEVNVSEKTGICTQTILVQT